MPLPLEILDLSDRLAVPTDTVPVMLQLRAALSGDASALWERDSATGRWQSISWAGYRDRVAVIARGLSELGLRSGDRVAILAPSTPRWDQVQLAILATGGVVVGLDSNDLDDNLDSIAGLCALTGLVAENAVEARARFSPAVVDRLRFVVELGNAPVDEGITPIKALVGDGDPPSADIASNVQPDDPATIIFTSGTTGCPKGIEYSHRQVCLAVASILEAFSDLGTQSHLACWLPLSNLFQRIINILAIAAGAQIYYVSNPREIMRRVPEINPDLFIGVPRFYEKLYAGIMARIDAGPRWRRALVGWALRRGGHQARAQREQRQLDLLSRFGHHLAVWLILRRLRGLMGSRLRYMVSGSAPMPRWLLERFHAMGLLLLEAYGISENIIPVAANRPSAYRFGTVGQLMRGCEIRLADDGELLVRGPGVANSYLGEDKGLLDVDGFLPSGDYAEIDDRGFVTLNGRKSEIFKTATGRRIAPAGIESYLLEVPGVEHAVVFGAGRPFVVALVVVVDDEKTAAERSLGEWCHTALPTVRAALAPLPGYKRPGGLVLTARPLSVESGELTTNLKLRRREITARYETAISALYDQLATAGDQKISEPFIREDEDMFLCSL